MDGQRFDELTRRLSAGLSRRQLVRVLLGGAGALATTTVFRESVWAVPIGGDCESDEDCDGDLVCGPGESGCQCDVSAELPACPAGSVHNEGKAEGLCCNGNGNCCSNNCVDNVCSGTPLCSEETGACDEANPCCAGLICFSGTCEIPCSTDGDCVPSDLGPCCNAACDTTNGICFKFGDDDLCDAGSCQFCDSNTGTCVYSCNEGEEICCNDQCVVGVCCTAADCTETESCFEAECYEGQCVYTPNDDLCDDFGDCSNKECLQTGFCSYTGAPENCSGCQFCNDEYVCTDGCPNGQVCCDEACVEGQCCIDSDCELSNCASVACTNHICGAVSLCPPQGPEEFLCCPHEGEPELDYCYTPAEGECCFDEECDEVLDPNTCFAGVCTFDAEAEVGLCGFVPDDSQCDQGECCCEDGTCSADCCDLCQEFSEECGLTVNGTLIASGSDQLDCCDGLVCCEGQGGHFCAECCGDGDCPKGTICCVGVCREIECCIDDILIGLDPNARCPESCTCFEGLCVDKDQNHCRVCVQDKECPEGECCCRNGICSHHCCGEPGCKSDTDCAKDTCCCSNGSCSHNCCDQPDDDTPLVDALPNTGTGPGEDAASWIAGAALAAGAAALLGAKTRQEPDPGGESKV